MVRMAPVNAAVAPLRGCPVMACVELRSARHLPMLLDSLLGAAEGVSNGVMRTTRHILVLVLGLSALASAAHAQPGAVTVRNLVTDLAASSAAQPYRPPLPNPHAGAIGYTEYLGIRVRPGREIWSERGLDFELHPMPLGSLFALPVELNLVDGGRISTVTAGGGLYEHSLPRDKIPRHGDLGISGFRITTPLNTPRTMDEVVVFQGASYFRILSMGQVYGLSARGLSINAGQPGPEEFPNFTRFWVETPSTRDEVVLHGLLDSPSIAGAYRFRIKPGDPTVVDVETTLYPRTTLHKVGIAPLSSMYFYAIADGTHHPRDYRPEVHDSDGLLIVNGAGERLWRPLRNPGALRASSFTDAGTLRGFGLIQRQRDFAVYQDLEANYHRRPSAWIEPLSDWGAGAVELFEIPTDSEYHDNIVAQWRPAEPLEAGKSYRFAYRISWPDRVPAKSASATVAWTRSGPANNASSPPGSERFVIDYDVPGLDPAALPRAYVTASAGIVSSTAVQPNPHTGGLRLSFLYQPAGNDVAELRVDLQGPRASGAEIWVYQWSRARDASSQ
jgi:glucans biosynthesis protein